MSTVWEPKISVVIPVYNGEAYIADTVRSVLMQERPAHEIWVVDDGSTDRTAEILAGFGSKIIYRRIANTGGPSEPRNLAIREAKGDWIALLDADDIWFRHKLLVEADYIRRFPQVGFFGSNYITRSHKGRLIRHSAELILKNYTFGRPLPDAFGRLFVENYFGTPSTTLFLRSAALEAGLFDPRHRVVEDLDFFIRLAAQTPVLLIPEILSYKRVHLENVSRDKVRLFAVHLEIIQESHKRFADRISRGHLEKRVLRGKALLEKMLGDAYFESGQIPEAFREYRAALRDSRDLILRTRVLGSMIKKRIRQIRGIRTAA